MEQSYYPGGTVFDLEFSGSPCIIGRLRPTGSELSSPAAAATAANATVAFAFSVGNDEDGEVIRSVFLFH